MLESVYQSNLIKKLRRRFPGCIILKNDSGYLQGIPDLLILFQDKWALLEVKVSADAEQQPNQEYYIDRGNELSFAAFIYPENETEVLNALQTTFEYHRPSRVPIAQ
jgi:hypothetical protein